MKKNKKSHRRKLLDGCILSPFICICAFIIPLFASAQPDTNLYPGNSGFTRKANASNTLNKGIKEGLWLDYVDSALYVTTDTHAPYYLFTYYKNGMPFRKIMGFYKNGKLWSELPMVNGKKNGVQKTFYPNGRLRMEIPFTDGLRNGVYKEYFDNGTVKSEYPYAEGNLNGAQKFYFPNGKLNLEIDYKNGQAGETKVYDKNGNEVK